MRLLCVRMGVRRYGTPCNIYKDESILKSDNNHSFKKFRIDYICPTNAHKKFDYRV